MTVLAALRTSQALHTHFHLGKNCKGNNAKGNEMVALEWDYSKYDSQLDEWNAKGVYPGHFDFNVATHDAQMKSLHYLDNIAYDNIYSRRCCIGKITIQKPKGETE